MAEEKGRAEDKKREKRLLGEIRPLEITDGDSGPLDLQLLYYVKIKKEMAMERLATAKRDDKEAKNPATQRLLEEVQYWEHVLSTMVELRPTLRHYIGDMAVAMQSLIESSPPATQSFLRGELGFLKQLNSLNNEEENKKLLLPHIEHRKREISKHLQQATDPASQQLLTEYLGHLEKLQSIIVNYEGVVSGNCHVFEELAKMCGEIDRLPQDAKKSLKARDDSAQLARDVERMLLWDRTKKQFIQAPEPPQTETFENLFDRVFSHLRLQSPESGLGDSFELEIVTEAGEVFQPPKSESSVLLVCKDDIELGEIFTTYLERLLPKSRQATFVLMPSYHRDDIYHVNTNGHSVSITSTEDSIIIVDQATRKKFPRSAYRDIAKCIFDTRRKYYIETEGALELYMQIIVWKPLLAPEEKKSEKLELKTPPAYPSARELLQAQKPRTKQQKGGLLLLAMKYHAFPFAKHLLQSEVDLEICNSSENFVTPLLVAAAQGNCEMLTELIVKGAALDAENNDGENALIIAAKHRQFNAVELLYNSHAPLRNQDKTKNAVDMPTVRLFGSYQAIKQQPAAHRAALFMKLFYEAIPTEDVQLAGRLLAETPQLIFMADYKGKNILTFLLSDQVSPDVFQGIMTAADSQAIRQPAFLTQVVGLLLKKLMAPSGITDADMEKLAWLSEKYDYGVKVETILNEYFQGCLQQEMKGIKGGLSIAIAMMDRFKDVIDPRDFIHNYISLLPPQVQSLALFALLSNVKDENARGAISFAAFEYALKRRPLLRDAMLDQDLEIINLRNEEGNTALHIAALDGNERVVDFLLSQLNIEIIENADGQMPQDLPGITPAIRNKLIDALAHQVAMAPRESKLAVASPAIQKPERKMPLPPSGLLARSLPGGIAAPAPQVAPTPVKEKPKVDDELVKPEAPAAPVVPPFDKGGAGGI